jgi:uncharacterized protein YuzE
VATYGFTEYFENEVLRKRPYVVSVLGLGPGARQQISACRHTGRQADNSQRILGQAVQTMKVNYHPETDSLYIDLSEQPSVESREISEGVVLDYDESGNLVGIDIDNASQKVELQRFVVSRIPARIETAG